MVFSVANYGNIYTDDNIKIHFILVQKVIRFFILVQKEIAQAL